MTGRSLPLVTLFSLGAARAGAAEAPFAPAPEARPAETIRLPSPIGSLAT